MRMTRRLYNKLRKIPAQATLAKQQQALKISIAIEQQLTRSKSTTIEKNTKNMKKKQKNIKNTKKIQKQVKNNKKI